MEPAMRLSIRTRMLVLTNLLVIATAVALGVGASHVAGEVVEQRLVRRTVSRTVAFVRTRNVPFSDTLLRYLREMFAVEFVAVRAEDGRIVAGTFAADETEQLRGKLAGLGRSGTLRLGETGYRVESHDVPGARRPGGRREDLRLYAVAPQSQFAEARRRASRRVALVTLPALGVATALAFALSVSISRPIRRLADEMDHTARRAAEEDAGEAAERGAESRQASVAAPRRGGPREVARLGESFDDLMVRLARAQRRLRQAERLAALGRVAASVAHELRNPLSGIKMHVRVLDDELSADTDRRTLRTIGDEIDRLDLYVDELMDLAAGQGGPAASAATEPVSLAEVSDSVLALMERRCRHAGVEVRRRYDPATRPASAQPVRVRQVLLNLVVNALESMAGGSGAAAGSASQTGSGSGGTLTVRVMPVEDGGARRRACVEVADTGRGLDQADGDPFEPFVTTKPGSAGLGLYLSRRIVERLGGRISYRRLEAGTAFRVELPAHRRGSGDPPAA
ncbi:MAG: two-component system sensor histidine kinase NtrB [Planctomycetota bacterium]